MTDWLQIKSYEVPVNYKPDLCVIGAGPSGLSAAVAASRSGLSVLLVEKYGFSGGATVAGLSGTICGLFSTGQNPGQIVFGFAGEFYNALKSRNGVTDPVRFGKTLLVPHDSMVWKEVADAYLTANKITILYHTRFVKAFIDTTGKITSVLMHGHQGQFAVQPKMVIDASGDAEVVHSISGVTFLGKQGVVQTPTMIFKMANVDIPAFTRLDPFELNKMVTAASNSGNYRLPRHHVFIFPLPNSGEVLCNMTRITYPDGTVPLGLNVEDLTFAEMEGRIQSREYARFLVEQVPAFNNAYLVDTGVQVGIRQTRSIVGQKTLLNEDVMAARKDKNGITCSAWPMEIHGTGELKIVTLENDFYDIPFETLIPIGAINLLVAGRCMSAEHEALASARVTAQCFGMGYAAGAACGLMLDEKIDAHNLDGMMVKHWMKQQHLKNGYEQ